MIQWSVFALALRGLLTPAFRKAADHQAARLVAAGSDCGKSEVGQHRGGHVSFSGGAISTPAIRIVACSKNTQRPVDDWVSNRPWTYPNCPPWASRRGGGVGPPIHAQLPSALLEGSNA